MDSPWKTADWWVSHLNFDPKVRQGLTPSPAVALHDVTLRDGEECAGLVLDVDDKVQIAQALHDVGIKRIEVGLKMPRSEEAVRRIKALGFGDNIYLAGKLIKRENFERALSCGATRIILGVHTSDVLIENALHQTREQVVQQCMDTLRLAKKFGLIVTLFLADTPRADLDFLHYLVTTAVNEGHAEAVAMVDTYSLATPEAITYLVRTLRSWVSVPVEAHCHNDYGLGLANAVAACGAGATVIHTSVNGLGYRCGNPATEEVAVALRVLYGVDLGLRYDRLFALSQLVQRLSGIQMAFNKPIVGAGAFAYEQYEDLESFIAAGIPEAGFPYLPVFVGQRQHIVLSKWSDLAALRNKLAELGLSVSAVQLQALLPQIKDLAMSKKRPLNDDDIRALIQAMYPTC